jgi:hypothetical protein
MIVGSEVTLSKLMLQNHGKPELADGYRLSNGEPDPILDNFDRDVREKYRSRRKRIFPDAMDVDGPETSKRTLEDRLRLHDDSETPDDVIVWPGARPYGSTLKKPEVLQNQNPSLQQVIPQPPEPQASPLQPTPPANLPEQSGSKLKAEEEKKNSASNQMKKKKKKKKKKKGVKEEEEEEEEKKRWCWWW